MTVATLRLPRPLPHQIPILNDPSPRKLWRAGRRVGKSVAARIAGTRGHGPKVNGVRAFPGMLQGADIAWITKTYKQAKVVWRKLLKTFAPLEGIAVKIDREDKRIEMVTGQGSLTVWSGHTRDAIDNVRGDSYGGVILDEGAYIDAEYAINDVIEPTLLEGEGGWLFVISTPNAGWDKNEARVTPSYFNRLCRAVMDGLLKGWRHWHNKTEDNPRLNAAAIAELRGRYPEGSPTAQQELDAELIVGGILALAINRASVVVDPFTVPAHWQWFASFDWGFKHPYSFQLWAVNEDGVAHLVDRLAGREQVPAAIAQNVGVMLKSHGLTFKHLRYTAAGHDCWHEIKARGERTPTIAEQFQRAGWILQRANIDRVAGLNNMRDYFATDRVKVMRRKGTMEALTCWETRISDPQNAEDVLKQDADINGMGGDDDYDSGRYALASRPLRAKAPAVPIVQGQVDEAKLRRTVQRPADSPRRAPTFRSHLVKR